MYVQYYIIINTSLHTHHAMVVRATPPVSNRHGDLCHERALFPIPVFYEYCVPLNSHIISKVFPEDGLWPENSEGWSFEAVVERLNV